MSNVVEEISDTIRDKIKEITKDGGSGGSDNGGPGGSGNGGPGGSDNENYQKILIELLQKTSAYNKQTKPAYIKKEFQLLVDQYFPLPKGSNDDG